MILTILIVLLFIQFILNQEANNKGKTFWLRHKKSIVLLSMMLFPTIILNVYLPHTYLNSSDELIEYGDEQENFAYTKKGYEQKFLFEPKNVVARYEYVDLYAIYGTSDCEFLKFDLFFFDTTTELLTLAYIELKCEKRLSEALAQQLKNYKKNVPFKNYLLGYQAYLLNDSSCTEYFLKDIEVNPNYLNTYNLIADYYYFNKQYDKLDAYISNPKYRKNIDVTFRNYYQFVRGNWMEYAHAIFDSRVRNVSIIAVFAAFLISLIWSFFLWKLDVFNPEKWYHLLIVFALGTLFTFLALPIYDLTHYYFEFELNGHLLNDALYSVLVIGGSEELVKLLPWLLFAFFTKRLKEPFDYILYASIAALGFAFTENWMYLEDSSSIVRRGLISTVEHMFDASIIAYSLVLYRFKYADKKWKILIPFAGFILAALSHGFYDFWLISSWSENLEFITILFFILSLHFWFHIKNNSINHSTYYKSNAQLNLTSIQESMTFIIIGLIMLEYVIFSTEYGAIQGNKLMRANLPFVAFFIIYFNYQVSTLKVEQGIWMKFKLQFPKLLSSIFRFKSSKRKGSTTSYVTREVIGQTFTFYTPKSNVYIGNQLPISGTITHRLTVDGDENWYIIHLSKELKYSNYEPHCALVRVVNSSQSIFEDKVEVLFLMVTSIQLLKGPNLNSRDFRYTGKVYARWNKS